jgi:predicted NAD/FAD-binding protein
MRVAVIGMGIAGNAGAWSLSKRYPITVYDRDIRRGGHSHTVTIESIMASATDQVCAAMHNVAPRSAAST